MNFDNLDVAIRDIQMVQIELLAEVDRICKKYGIKYQLFSGTLLGAIRHKGFIPWDDDIDICLLREDYDKLLDACKMELDSKYFLQYSKTDPHSTFLFSKLRKNNTIFRTSSYKETDMHEGIFIDIFPMDNVKAESMMGELHRKFCHFAHVLISSTNKSRCYSVKSPIRKYMRLLFYYLTKPFSRESIHKLCDKLICIYNSKDTLYVGCVTNGASKSEYENFTVKKDTFHNLIEGEFEGYKFPIPRDYDYVLTKNYGDYMTPPPIEQQKPHHGIIKISFDTSSDIENK